MLDWRAQFNNILRKGRDFSADLFPPLCVHCQQRYTRSAEIEGICPSCLSQLPWRQGEAGLLQVLSNRIEREIDINERQYARQFSVIVPLYYSSEIPRLIRHLKFHGRLELAKPLAQLMAVAVRLQPLERFDTVVSVPLHPKRMKERGYNQAYELSKALADELGVVDLSSAFSRQIDTLRQSELPYSQRRSNLDQAFVADRRVLARRHVLLVDDILTSGATLWSAIQAIDQAGAASVTAVVVASGRKQETTLL